MPESGLAYDLLKVIKGTKEDHFNVLLLRLIVKANAENLQKLSSVYADHVRVYEDFKQMGEKKFKEQYGI